MYNTDIKQISLKKIKIKLRFAFFLAHGSKSYYSTSNTLEYYTENPLPVLKHVTEEHGLLTTSRNMSNLEADELQQQNNMNKNR